MCLCVCVCVCVGVCVCVCVCVCAPVSAVCVCVHLGDVGTCGLVSSLTAVVMRACVHWGQLMGLPCESCASPQCSHSVRAPPPPLTRDFLHQPTTTIPSHPHTPPHHHP